MADHQEMIRAADSSAAMYNNAGGGVQASRGGGADSWWSTAESPAGSLAPAGSSITFQEPPAAAGWNQTSFLDDGSGFHGYMSSRPASDHQAHHHINPPPSLLMSPSSSNNNSSNMMLQLQQAAADQHDPNYQFLSNLGFELLSSPAATPYAAGGGGSRPASSLLRSLTEPSASAKPSYQPASVATTPFWNPTTGFDAAAYRASLAAAGPPPAQSRPASLAAKNTVEGVGESSSCMVTKKTSSGPTAKKARTGTPPSPLPTFKVRKEKLGDRVTALQQLVSPFGKTDTASVLHETIEYIKFLHEQVGAHSAPYLKNRQQQVPHSKISSADKKNNGGEEAARDLMGRGLCLVPISSTFAVASETPVVDYWNPFGAAFR